VEFRKPLLSMILHLYMLTFIACRGVIGTNSDSELESELNTAATLFAAKDSGETKADEPSSQN
jgi:hypothetical protein